MATTRARSRRSAVRSARATARPMLEGLETRQLLATYSVTTTADSGPGSLRSAILQADAAPATTNVITFAITPGSGVQTISLQSALPAITTPMTIDGTTQNGYLGNPIVAIDGSNAGTGAVGLSITGGGTTIRGIVVDHFDGPGIAIATGGNNTLIQDYVGVNAVGLVADGNGSDGILINNSAGNTIGGTTTTTDVIISGNAGAGIRIIGSASTGNTILGGFIGTDATGNVAIGNAGPGIEIDGGSGNTIGTTVSGGRNIISGNGGGGVALIDGASGNTVIGSYIGTTVAGNAALPNNVAGVLINASSTNTIGGSASGDANVISGNSGSGVLISGASATGNLLLENLIGVSNVGTAAVPNQSDGVTISGGVSNTIGGTSSGVGNVISSNVGNGISLLAGATGNLIQGNDIGTDAAAAVALGNGLEGIFVQASSTNTIGVAASASGTTAGATNQIANNKLDGVFVASGKGNTIRQNATYSNAGLAIELASGANNDLVAPVLSSSFTSGGSSSVTGTYTGTSGSTYTIDFYSNPVFTPGLGQGKVYIGSTTVTPSTTGAAAFTFTPANPVAVGSVVSATATDTAGDTSQFSNQALVSAPSVNLGINGFGSVNPVGVGGTLVDTFLITNFGPVSATDVTVTDTIPSGLNILMTTSTTGVISLSGNSFSVNLGTLASGGTATVTLAYQPLVAGTIVDTAKVTTADQTVNNPQDDTSTVTTTVQPSAYLVLSDTASPTTAAVNGLLSYNLTVQNKGPSAAAGVVVTDAIPAGATIISASASQGSAPSSGNVVSASLGAIPAGGTATVTIVVQPTAVGTLTDSASLSSTTVNPFPTSVTASASATITTTGGTTPVVSDGPTVVGVARSGVQTMPTKYAIGFNSALLVSTAQNVANYSVIDLGKNGKSSKAIAITSATFNAANNSVTITLAKRIPLGDKVQLAVNGLTATGVAGTNGLLLDGAGTGTPGSNYVVTFTGFGPSTGSVSTSSAHPRAPKVKAKH